MSIETPFQSIEDLRATVDGYIDHAVANGQLTESQVNVTEHFGVIGSTSVETESGVQIRKGSDGSMYFYTEYLETTDKGSADIQLAVDIYSDPFEMTATETRYRLVNGEATGEVDTKTLPKRSNERVARELAQLIRQNF